MVWFGKEFLNMKYHCKYDELLDPDDPKLKPNPDNPNNHSPEQIERLIKILKYQGWRYAVKISLLSKFISSGHGRVLAALEMGCQVPVVYQDYDNADMEYADLVADNSIASWSDLDLSSINENVADLGPDFDIDLLGIDGFKIDVADRGGPDKLSDDTIGRCSKCGQDIQD